MAHPGFRIPIEDSRDPRRRLELKDAMMLNEDHTAMANLPEKPIHAQYKHFGLYSNRHNSTE